jgi:DNA-binding SARP family transcriptional activator
MTRLSLTLLGDFQSRLGPEPPLRLRTRKTQALLAYLALPPGQPHSRDKLAALLWGDRSPHQARSRLGETLFALRQALAAADPPCLELGSETLGLNADAVDVDALAFERLVQAGSPEALAQAVDLYRGDLLEGLAFRSALFEDWLMGERERLRELALDALAKLLAHQRSAGSAEAALPTALRLIALDPLQEAVHRTLMRLYAQLGRRGAALRQYQLCVGVLQRELGVEPEAETKALYQELLRRPAPAMRAPSFDGDDRSRPARLAAGARVELPAGDTPLFGRAAELGRLREAAR